MHERTPLLFIQEVERYQDEKTSGADFTTNLHFWIYRTVKIINENYIIQHCYENNLNMEHVS